MSGLLEKLRGYDPYQYDDAGKLYGKLGNPCFEAAVTIEELVEQLSIMTEHYVKLAGCGDCGHWNPEEEEEVIAARKLLAQVQS